MNKLKTIFALSGIRTYRQRIDDFCNAQYYHIQDWILVFLILIFLGTLIAL